MGSVTHGAGTDRPRRSGRDVAPRRFALRDTSRVFRRPGEPRFGIRLQATLAVAGIVAAALVTASVALLLLLQNSLTSTLQDSVDALLAEDATTLQSGGLDALRASEIDRGQNAVLVQVVDSSGGL